MSVEEPSVTFLCTAYRTEATICQTLDSVMAQTRDDWQLVVVDNGPSDTIVALVEPYLADPRVTLVRQDNCFAWGGVNAAARHAKGRYVAVLHTDDLVLPTFVERLVPLMDADDDTAALAPDALFLNEAGVREETFRQPVPARYKSGDPVGLRELIEGWVPYYTALVRRKAWEDIGGFRNDIPTVEDLGLWLDLIARGYVLRTLDEPLAAYRENENSDSRGARGIEVMEESWSRLMTEMVTAHGTDADRAALETALGRSRHRAATVRARRLLLDGDYEGAQAAARMARDERDDLRTRVLAGTMQLSPAGVRA
ncbi:glycosyltransferase, partial [Nocardioides sp.]|uniref:glycosyltransferase n=1 Tax=Nocardioides sp. TaxID=35761 RepID=UPI002B26F99B